MKKAKRINKKDIKEIAKKYDLDPIDIQDIVCNGAGRAMEFNGLPEMPIKGIKLKNIVIKAKKDATFTNAEDITKENIHIVVE